MNRTNNYIKILLFFLIVSFFVSFSLKVTAVEQNEEEESSNYSEAYKHYLKLSDEEKTKLEVIPRKYNIPLDILYENTIKFKDFSKDSDKKYKTISVFEKDLPIKFDLRDKINIQVEDQGAYGLCWDFASIKSLETNLALSGKEFDFSELHVDYLESNLFGGWRELHDGGNFETFKDYVGKEYGPVFETEVPYDAVYSEKDCGYLLGLKPKAYVYQTIDFPTINKAYQTFTEEELELFKTKIKKHIMENGSLYCVIATPDYGTQYFNYETNAEYFTGDMSQISQGREFHAVSIIGWDDNYSRENFNENQRPEKDGAYIALNSWGDFWGENGIFYISYEDYQIGDSISGIISSGLEETEHKEIKFKDRNLYNAIKKYFNLKKDFDDNTMSINISDVLIKQTTFLSLYERSISDLSGLESFYNLNGLELNGNKITSLEPIKKLENLDFLLVDNCNISRIPDELEVEYIGLHNQKMSIDLKNNLEVNNETRININDVFSYDKAIKYQLEYPNYYGQMNLNTEKCNLDLDNKSLIITPTKVGKGQSTVKINNGVFDGSIFTINYKAKDAELNIEPYIFDAKYYADNNADLKRAFGYDANKLKNHYFNWGIKEGRKSSSVFDINYYMRNNPDIEKAFNNNILDAFYHFVNFGIYEGRQASEEFDVKFYIEQYPDIANAYNSDYASCLIHYVDYGKNEGRYGSENIVYKKQMKSWVNVLFDKDLYYSLYPDLQRAFGDNEVALKEHYINFGVAEGRIGSYIIDQKYYINKYPDLKKVYGNNYRKAVMHFLTCGYREGRCASKMFDVNYYKNMNADVSKAYKYDNYKIISHFLNFGINEGRLCNKEFDVTIYKNKNIDLSLAFSNNWKKYYWHYMIFGKNENRIYN